MKLKRALSAIIAGAVLVTSLGLTALPVSAATAINGVKSMSEAVYDSFFDYLESGAAKTFFAQAEKKASDGYASTCGLTRFAIASSDGENPYLLLTGIKTDAEIKKNSTSWLEYSKYVGECTYALKYDSFNDSVSNSNIKFTTGSRLAGVGSWATNKNIIYLNKSSKIAFTTFVENWDKWDGNTYYTMDFNSSNLNGKYKAAKKANESQRVKNGTYKKIKWYKISEISKAKKDYSKLVKKSAATATTIKGEDRATYYADSSCVLSYLPYQLKTGEFIIEKSSKYTKYKFSKIDDAESKTAYFALDEASSIPYYNLIEDNYAHWDVFVSVYENLYYDVIFKDDGSYVCIVTQETWDKKTNEKTLTYYFEKDETTIRKQAIEGASWCLPKGKKTYDQTKNLSFKSFMKLIRDNWG